MGYRKLQIKLSTDYTEEDLKKSISSEIGLKDFSFQIEKKSLDARKKNNAFWLINVIVSSLQLAGEEYIPNPSLKINYKKRDEKVVVVGSGPAGFFAAYILQLAGYKVSIIERGSEVECRSKAINQLENEGNFSEQNNYVFGEGGAGTFSDGKLTSRSKHISLERDFILQEYVKAGAPQEITYMAHPHVGTDNLKIVATNLRKKFLENGGSFLFNTQMEDLGIKGKKVEKILCNTGEIECDYLILATGHSAYDSYRMLIKRGLQFGTKNFAIGHRIEHPSALINMSQWGIESLPGVKAAEYRLTSKTSSEISVYTFCMCPGGNIIPAAAYKEKSTLNGMSYYERNGKFSNAGIVAGIHPDHLLGHKCTALEALDWIDAIEGQYYKFSDSLEIPAAKASDYMEKRGSRKIGMVSYKRGIRSARLHIMLPEMIVNAISEGIRDFSRKVRGFEKGVLMGLESKTSSPIQVAREKDGSVTGFDNLYFVGEGSGYSGGIISSAADGVRCAMALSSL